METDVDRSKPYIKHRWIVNGDDYFVVYTPDNKRHVFDTKDEAEGFMAEWPKTELQR